MYQCTYNEYLHMHVCILHSCMYVLCMDASVKICRVRVRVSPNPNPCICTYVYCIHACMYYVWMQALKYVGLGLALTLTIAYARMYIAFMHVCTMYGCKR